MSQVSVKGSEGSHVGTVAGWDRALSPAEVLALLPTPVRELSAQLVFFDVDYIYNDGIAVPDAKLYVMAKPGQTRPAEGTITTGSISHLLSGPTTWTWGFDGGTVEHVGTRGFIVRPPATGFTTPGASADEFLGGIFQAKQTTSVLRVNGGGFQAWFEVSDLTIDGVSFAPGRDAWRCNASENAADYRPAGWPDGLAEPIAVQWVGHASGESIPNGSALTVTIPDDVIEWGDVVYAVCFEDRSSSLPLRYMAISSGLTQISTGQNIVDTGTGHRLSGARHYRIYLPSSTSKVVTASNSGANETCPEAVLMVAVLRGIKTQDTVTQPVYVTRVGNTAVEAATVSLAAVTDAANIPVDGVVFAACANAGNPAYAEGPLSWPTQDAGSEYDYVVIDSFTGTRVGAMLAIGRAVDPAQRDGTAATYQLAASRTAILMNHALNPVMPWNE